MGMIVDFVVALLFAFCAGAVLERVFSSGHIFPYVGATGLGALVGLTELVSRYRDKPQAAIYSIPGIFYIGLNAAVSLIVLWLIRTGQLDIPTPDGIGKTLGQVLLAGVGSMALLRTSLFTLRVKESDVSIGPAALLQVILSAADRACDRLRAGPRAAKVKTIMEGVSFASAGWALPLHCLALMQNLSADEKTALEQAINALSGRKDLSDEIKSYNLGLLLMNCVGEEVLEEAVRTLGTIIQGPPPDDPPIFAQAQKLVIEDMPTLIEYCIQLDPVRRPPDEIDRNRPIWQANDENVTQDRDKIIILLAKLRKFFGVSTLSQSITILVTNKRPAIKSTNPVKLTDLQ